MFVSQWPLIRQNCNIIKHTTYWHRKRCERSYPHVTEGNKTIITARKRSCGKVILFTGGSASVHAGIPPPPEVGTPLRSACWEMRSTGGRGASYWNAILLLLLLLVFPEFDLWSNSSNKIHKYHFCHSPKVDHSGNDTRIVLEQNSAKKVPTGTIDPMTVVFPFSSLSNCALIPKCSLRDI